MSAAATTNSEDRQTCWKVRDFYLSCLNSSFTADQLYESLKTAAGDDGKAEIIPRELRSMECNELRAEMYKKCPLSWAEHFEKKFRGDKLKEYQLKKLKEIGAQPL